jgi:hypothetical protein
MNKRLFKANVKGKNLIWEVRVENNSIYISSYFQGSCKKREYLKELKNYEDAVKEAISRLNDKLRSGYSLCKEINVKFMKFESINDLDGISWINQGCFLQPKLKGVRCIAFYDSDTWIMIDKYHHPVTSKSIKQKLDEDFDKTLIYDGELTHPDDIDVTDITSSPDITFNIFDLVNDKAQYDRLERLYEFGRCTNNVVKIVETIEVSSIQDAKYLHSMFVGKGFEGSILRSKHAVYGYGCLKID